MTAAQIEVFRPGRHTSSSGDDLEFSPADVAALAAAYDPKLHEAPIVVGHPAHDLPAYGWVRKLAVQGGNLVAELDQVDPEFRELVQAGRYKKISASFYRPDAPANPKPGTWYLRHVGFLGAQAPAVKGLKPVQFAAGDGSVEFYAPSEMAMIEAARDSRDRAVAKITGRSAVDYQERMAALGIVVTTAEAVRHVYARQDALKSFAGGQAQSAAYAEGVAREAQAIQAGSSIPLSLPEAVRRAETAIAARLADGRPAGLEPADPVDIGRRAQAHKARLAQMGVVISASEAVRQVLDGAVVA